MITLSLLSKTPALSLLMLLSLLSPLGSRSQGWWVDCRCTCWNILHSPYMNLPYSIQTYTYVRASKDIVRAGNFILETIHVWYDRLTFLLIFFLKGYCASPHGVVKWCFWHLYLHALCNMARETCFLSFADKVQAGSRS
jgi:hypothetical protein